MSDPTDQTRDLEQLVGDWLTVPDVAQRCDVPLSTVRRWIEERDLVAHRIGERRVVAVPARFVDEEGPVPALRGTFTVLADGGMDDAEIIGWLHEPDETLPLPPAPIDSLLGGFKTEVRRRAMETAF